MSDDELVTTKLAKRSKRRDDDRGKGPRRGRDRDGASSDRSRGPKPEADRPQKPKVPRLKPKRIHRDAFLETVQAEHKPIAEQLLKDGMPGVRSAIEKQNVEAKAADQPAIEEAPVMKIAEKHLHKARLAEWRDRADAALATSDVVDLRDLRSVVAAGDGVAKEEETRAMLAELKQITEKRLESDHNAWIADLTEAVTEARVVRALRLSSRPVKAGAPLPSDLASKLAAQVSENLTTETTQQRWATVLDALAYSPVRAAAKPPGIPAEPGAELIKEVRRLSDRLPAIAELFGIKAADVPKSEKRQRPYTARKPKDGKAADSRSKDSRPSGGKPGERKPRDSKPRDGRGRDGKGRGKNVRTREAKEKAPRSGR